MRTSNFLVSSRICFNTGVVPRQSWTFWPVMINTWIFDVSGGGLGCAERRPVAESQYRTAIGTTKSLFIFVLRVAARKIVDGHRPPLQSHLLDCEYPDRAAFRNLRKFAWKEAVQCCLIAPRVAAPT